MKTIYISGPITDLTTGQPRDGWQQDFLDAEAKLRRMGFQVINPVDIAREVDEEWRKMWSLQGDMNKWNGPIANAFLKQGPTRADYIMACLQRMKMAHSVDRLHGVYVIGGGHWEVMESHGVQMEMLMADILGLPIYAECHEDLLVDSTLVPMDDDRTIKELLNGQR